MNRKIAIQIENELERNRFNSLLDIIPPRLNCTWLSVTPEQADVVIVDIREPGSEYFMETCKATTSALPVAYGETNSFNSQWYIKSPVNAVHLVSLLNQINDFLTSASSEPTSQPEKEGSDDDQAKDSSIAIQIKSMIEKANDLSCFTLSLEHTPFIYISQEQKQAIITNEMMKWKTITNVEPFKAGSLQYNPIKKSEYDRFSLENDVISFSLSELDWFLFAFFSQGKLHPELNSKAIYQLKNWPNFARLPHTPMHVMLCAKLIKKPQSLQHLINGTGVKEQVAVSFINACASQNLLLSKGVVELSEISSESAQKKPPVVEKIIRRLFG